MVLAVAAALAALAALASLLRGPRPAGHAGLTRPPARSGEQAGSRQQISA